MTAQSESDSASTSTDLIPLVVVFGLVIGFTYSDDMVEFALEATGRMGSSAGPWLVVAADMVLVLGTAALKWRMNRSQTDFGSFVRQLCTGPWAIGAVLVITTHLALILTAEHRSSLSEPAYLGINLLATGIFVTAMTLLLHDALGSRTGSRSWLAPLVFGTLIAQLASALWYPVIDLEHDCANDISSSYFSDASNIFSVILLAIGVELNYTRRNAKGRDPGQRVAPVLTVVLMCVGLMLSLSMQVKADLGTRCGMAAVWHEYISFVVTAQSLAIGLATITWLMVVDSQGDR